MASKPANIFPENFRNIITSTFGVYTFQIVLVQMLQISPTEDTEAPLTLPESVLHPNELETFTKYKFPKRKNEFLTGRYCAKEAIIKLLPNTNNRIVNITMRDIEINANSDGRPAICIHTHTNVLPIDISIAHSKQYGTAVAAPKICGIDLQYSSKTLIKVQRRYCTATELQVIQNALPKETLLTILTHLWAAKEAAKKALSIWWMPGFLDLVVMDATIEYADCLRLTLSVPAQQHDTSIPRKVNVLASAISDYSMAVCFINKDPVNA